LRQALALLEEVIARDPNYGPALGLAAQCCHHLATGFTAPDRDTIRPKGIDFGRRAIKAAGDDPGVLADAAMALAVLGEDLDAMIAPVNHALALNPSFARGWHISGFRRLWAGRTELAIAWREDLAPRPAGTRGRGGLPDGCRFVLRPSFRGGRPKAMGCDRDHAAFPERLPLSCGVLCSYGVVRRSARDDREAARDYAPRDGEFPCPPAATRWPRHFGERDWLGKPQDSNRAAGLRA
jgi:hypothetical protein